MNMFGNLGKMGEMVQKARQLQAEIKQARYEAEQNGVKVVINGEMEIVDLNFPPDAKPAAVKEAVNRCLKTAKEDMAKKMSKITGGMGGLGGLLPGM